MVLSSLNFSTKSDGMYLTLRSYLDERTISQLAHPSRGSRGSDAIRLTGVPERDLRQGLAKAFLHKKEGKLRFAVDMKLFGKTV